MDILAQLGLTVPVFQAPMAGVATPHLAAEVSNVGGLGALGLGAAKPEQARSLIADVRARTDRPFNVNFFVHQAPKRDPEREARWLEWLAPIFAEYGERAPEKLSSPYTSLQDDPEMMALLLEVKPPVVSFHFGLPPASCVTALKQTGAVLLATVTSPAEALAAEAAGMDGVIAQGVEAGGHRGLFDPDAPDDTLGTLPLVRLLSRQCHGPVIAAGGIMDGAGLAAALDLGAVAAQMGTAFLLCPETALEEGYRKTLIGQAAFHTRLVSLISGRPARGLPNRFTALADSPDKPPCPDYPVAYDAGKALARAARAQGDAGFGAYWAGQGAPLVRALPAGRLMREILAEYQDILKQRVRDVQRPPHV
ncbi:NAD(P)H-dependent flavin oxidoreductase [Acetobacter orleanensis]|uniref:Nitronate monooxygenase n=1 Tax=Acetobacter orleanensis TaxID=104099 RepID=A0A4Y3TN31_9PROT|nr:nitronate monooxygenase [Acetobacter orleanensis]KXV66135.1 2-nitropropane dioxygenase [Acetobacter orleanensis]PCD79809.1 nitronate monooxygenase [Acetobacter orleanensis]GEB82370.1 2-nitropropane dioxygenase [Acetobacter orleanensis]